MADVSFPGVSRFTQLRVVATLAMVLLAAFLLLPPHSFEAKINLIGYGICHQEPNRSFIYDGHQLPLCARDTGTYLGGLVTLATILAFGKRRATGLPVPAVLFVLLLGFVFFVVDGVNSYADLIPIVPQIYPPDNRLRLLSGMAMGVGLMVIVVPLFNYTVWVESRKERILDGYPLLILLTGLAATFAVVVWGPDWVYYPLAFLSALSVLIVLSTVNGLLAIILLRREQTGTGWPDVAHVLCLGLLLTALELGTMSYLRHTVESALVYGP